MQANQEKNEWKKRKFFQRNDGEGGLLLDYFSISEPFISFDMKLAITCEEPIRESAVVAVRWSQAHREARARPRDVNIAVLSPFQWN